MAIAFSARSAEAVGDPLVPVFRANLHRVEVLLEARNSGGRVLESLSSGEALERELDRE